MEHNEHIRTLLFTQEMEQLVLLKIIRKMNGQISAVSLHGMSEVSQVRLWIGQVAKVKG